jgi:prepilin-type processing-associated H-X9-DG protein
LVGSRFSRPVVLRAAIAPGLALLALAAAAPVVIRGAEGRRQEACIANQRQVAAAFGLYAQDYDEHLPLASMPITPITWTVSVRPYLKNNAALRCPADRSNDWTLPYDMLPDPHDEATTGGQDAYRVSSYFFNLWLSGSRKYGKIASIKNPAKVIMLTESTESITRDHFHAPYWNADDAEAKALPGYDPMMRGFVWDEAKQEPEEIAIRRHNGGFNSIYVDGHARWAKWSQLWYVDEPHHIFEGAFDPRQ